MIYGSINAPVLSQVPKTVKRVLDIGCGSGNLGRKIKEDFNCEVIGITYSEIEAALANKYLDKVYIHNLNSFDIDSLGKFDCIICSHVLEHLYQPSELLKQLHEYLTADSIIIVALPNVLHFKQRLKFLAGRFRYTEGGLMDMTHFRFFDWETARELLENSGYTIVTSQSEGSFPLPMFRKFIPSFITSFIDQKAVQKFPGLFGFQFIFSCRLNS
ncbi:MAG: class I SAM-dependent methyltransferase [Calothrix sp. C42_A2020_038]|nr:class I SAM-dependent methyltransferase [Calothrix sp. C42_A2020_038]